MLVWNVLKRLRFKQLLDLVFLALKYPIYVYPTIKATTFSFKVAKKLYSKTHGKKGKGNAFRHALWNIMICFECYKLQKKKDRVSAWAKIITDKHEQLFPNKKLDTIMDLHNNKIGRGLFLLNDFVTTDQIIHKLNTKLVKAKQLTSVNDAKNYIDELVYLNETL